MTALDTGDVGELARLRTEIADRVAICAAAMEEQAGRVVADYHLGHFA